MNIEGKSKEMYFDEKGITCFANQLRKIRKAKKVTQEQLAFKAGISLSQVARIETSRINPTLRTVFRISRALDVPLREMFDFDIPIEDSVKG